MPRPPTDTGSPRSEPGPASAASGQQGAPSILTYLVPCLAVGASTQIAINHIYFKNIERRVDELSYKINTSNNPEVIKLEEIKRINEWAQKINSQILVQGKHLSNINDYVLTEQRNRFGVSPGSSLLTTDPHNSAFREPTKVAVGISTGTTPSVRREDSKGGSVPSTAPNKGTGEDPKGPPGVIKKKGTEEKKIDGRPDGGTQPKPDGGVSKGIRWLDPK